MSAENIYTGSEELDYLMHGLRSVNSSRPSTTTYLTFSYPHNCYCSTIRPDTRSYYPDQNDNYPKGVMNIRRSPAKSLTLAGNAALRRIPSANERVDIAPTNTNINIDYSQFGFS